MKETALEDVQECFESAGIIGRRNNEEVVVVVIKDVSAQKRLMRRQWAW